jgi:hypothetical protein
MGKYRSVLVWARRTARRITRRLVGTVVCATSLFLTPYVDGPRSWRGDTGVLYGSCPLQERNLTPMTVGKFMMSSLMTTCIVDVSAIHCQEQGFFDRPEMIRNLHGFTQSPLADDLQIRTILTGTRQAFPTLALQEPCTSSGREEQARARTKMRNG